MDNSTADMEQAAPQPLPLLSLPQGLLTTHVWPHLGPWARSQLCATCKQLLVVADGQLGPGLRVALTEEELRAAALQQTNHPGAAAGGSQLEALCRMLRRLPHITELTLAIRRPAAHTAADSTPPSDQAARPVSNAAALASALGRLGEAAGARLRKLAVAIPQSNPDAPVVHLHSSTYASPAVLSAVGSHFPHLTHLRLGAWEFPVEGAEPEGAGRGDLGDWAAALACLPPSLVRLQIEVSAIPWPGHSSQAFMQLLQAQALRLPALRSLHLWCTWEYADLSPLGQAPAACFPGLQHLSVYDRWEGVQAVQQLAAAVPRLQLGSSLRSLDLTLGLQGSSREEAGKGLAALLRQLPLLQHLSLYHPPVHSAPALRTALASMPHLTSLGLRQLVWCSESAPTQADAAWPPSLRRLRLRTVRQGWAQLLPLLPPCCHVVFDSEEFTGPAEAAAALAHPGGVSMALRTVDPLTNNTTELEMPGMVGVWSSEVLQAVAAATQPVRVLCLAANLGSMHPESAGKLLQSDCAANCLGQLHTLAISCIPRGPRGGSPDAAVWAAAQLLEAGQLPKLKKLLLQFQRYPPTAHLGLLRHDLLRLLQAGCAVHLLPFDCDACPAAAGDDEEAAFQWLVQEAPDPDMLLLGVREQVHGEGEFAA